MTSTIRCTLAIVLLSSVSAAAQDSLDPVRNLYASAEYEEALTAIGRLKSNAALRGVVEIDRYRALCLIALGRSAEANQAIETTVTLDPLYQPAAADASPRVREAFAAVRYRVLPTVVRSLYASAKAAYDRKAFAEAADGLDKTVRVIDNLEGRNPELDDLRMLAAGFLDLSKAAIAKPSLPPPPASTPAQASVNVVKSPVAFEPAPPLPFSNVVAKRQDLPPLPFSLATTKGLYRGAIEVEINEDGNVVGVRVIQSVHVLYDPLLLVAARDWKYEPARIDGRPTAVHKRVEVVLKP
jgi:tetratricopeptide (TPR) repeat protein